MFAFYLFRLRRASPVEIFHRLWDQVLYRLIRIAPALFRNFFQAPAVSLDTLKSLHLPDLVGDIPFEVISALLAGEVFSLNQDPKEIAAFEAERRGVFFTVAGPRHPDPDIRAVWEPARLQHLTLLLVHLRRSPDGERAAEIAAFVRKKLFEWLNAHPFLQGPHYLSAMECALRIPVFLLALKTLPRLTSGETRRLWQVLFEHGWLIEHRMSLGSSLGNHTVTEAVGLIMAGIVFEQSRKGRQWLKRGLELLKQESLHQILEDGGPAEQSLGYHRFVLDLCEYALDFLEARGLVRCPDFRDRLARAEAFWSAFDFSNECRPAIGDSDDGQAIAPGLGPASSGRKFAPVWPREVEALRFLESGYTIFRGPNRLHLVFDHGPLGMAPLYNHGHADALSVTLAVNGLPFFVDPGTYRYNGRPAERVFFKGTRAHNTVLIDGRDQARQVTGFIWDRPYQARAVEWGGGDAPLAVLAAHDGYARGREPVIHARLIFFPRPDVIMVRDTFSGQGRHVFEAHFHLHPAVRVDQAHGWTILTHNKTRVFVKFVDAEPRIWRGSRDPWLGWFSPAYGRIQETTVLQVTRQGQPHEARFTTVICLDQAAAAGERP